jgi:hypothetical protein
MIRSSHALAPSDPAAAFGRTRQPPDSPDDRSPRCRLEAQGALELAQRRLLLSAQCSTHAPPSLSSAARRTRKRRGLELRSLESARPPRRCLCTALTQSTRAALLLVVQGSRDGPDCQRARLLVERGSRGCSFDAPAPGIHRAGPIGHHMWFGLEDVAAARVRLAGFGLWDGSGDRGRTSTTPPPRNGGPRLELSFPEVRAWTQERFARRGGDDDDRGHAVELR